MLSSRSWRVAAAVMRGWLWPAHGHVVDAVQVGAGVRVVEVLPEPAHHLGRLARSRAAGPAGSRRAGAPAARSSARSRDRQPEQRARVRAERQPRLRRGRASRGPGRAPTSRCGATWTCRCAGSAPPCAHVPDDGARGHALAPPRPPARGRRAAPRARLRRARARVAGALDATRQRRPHLAALRREHVEAEVHRRGLGVRTLARRVKTRLAVRADRRRAASSDRARTARDRPSAPGSIPGSGHAPARHARRERRRRCVRRRAGRPPRRARAAPPPLPRRSPSPPRARAGRSRCAARARACCSVPTRDDRGARGDQMRQAPRARRPRAGTRHRSRARSRLRRRSDRPARGRMRSRRRRRARTRAACA